MRKCKLLTIAVFIVSACIFSACAKRTASEEIGANECVTETLVERTVLDVMSDALKEKYLNARAGEMICVAIQLKDGINLQEVEEMAEKKAGLTEEEKKLIKSTAPPNEEENQIILEALRRVSKERIKILHEHHEKTNREFIKSAGIPEDRIGSVGTLTSSVREVQLTADEIEVIALRPEVVYMDAEIIIVPPVIKIDTEKYDHMLSAASWESDTILRQLTLNKDKIEERGYGIGITKFDTLEELNEFKSNYTEALSLDTSHDEVKSFNTNTSKYDEQFFEGNTLIVIFFQGASSDRYGVYNIVSDGNKVCFEITETTGNEIQECASTEWIITILVPDEEVEEWSDYDVVYVDGQE